MHSRWHQTLAVVALSLGGCQVRENNASEELRAQTAPKSFSGKDMDGNDCKVTILGLEKGADQTTASPTAGTSTQPGSYMLSFSVNLPGNKLNNTEFKKIEQGFVQREVQGDGGRYKEISEKVVAFLRSAGHDPSGFNNNMIEFGILRGGLGSFLPWGRSVSIGIEESTQKPLYVMATASFPTEKYTNACLFQ